MEMLKLKNWWYNLVASEVVKRERNTHRLFLEVTDKLLRANSDRLQLQVTIGKLKTDLEHAKSDSAIAVEVINKRLGAGPVASILGAREHAANFRIQSLENDNIFLLGEVKRLKAKLAKFRQS